MKDRRNHTRWTNTEIEQDSGGYIAAQEAYAEDKVEAERQRREADDQQRFEEEFVRGGGAKVEASAAWRKHRNEQAAEAASRAEQATLSGARHRVRQPL